MRTLLVILSIGLVLAGAVFFPRGVRADTSAPGAVTAPAVPLASSDRAQIVKASGVVKPRVGAEVRVGSRLSGVVKRLHVQVGDPVRPGQRLAELDDRELLARRDEAEANHRSALAELRYVTSNLARQRSIAAARAISAGDLDQAERAFAVAEQQVAAAKAVLDYTQTQLDYTVIDAPIGGVVASVATQEGETVSASFSAPTFVTLIDLGRLEVWAYVDETSIGRVELGQRATVTVDTYGNEEFAGTVTAIYPKAEIRDNVVNYIAVVRFEPRPHRILRPEMTAIVHIAVSQDTGNAPPAAASARSTATSLSP